jgi:hypothetical protein
MIIGEINNSRVYINLNANTTKINSVARWEHGAQTTRSIKQEAGHLVEMHRDRLGRESLDEVNSSLNSVAKSIRLTDSAMETIETYIDQMKARLLKIVKNYPPFPTGSEERIKMLRSFNAFRKQIDQLTVPPVDKGAVKIMADPARVSGTDELQVGGGDKGAKTTIHRQEVHTGPLGLDIPELPEGVKDQGIDASIRNLDHAKQTLRQRRSDLAAEVTGFVNSAEFDSGAAGEAVAEQKSADLKDELAVVPGRNLSLNPSQLLPLLD